MLLKTRGAVAAITRFDEHEGALEIAGIGNIGVQLAMPARCAACPRDMRSTRCCSRTHATPTMPPV